MSEFWKCIRDRNSAKKSNVEMISEIIDKGNEIEEFGRDFGFSSEELKNKLRKMGIPELLKSAVDSNNYDKIDEIKDSIDDEPKLKKSLIKLIDLNIELIKLINKFEGDKI